MNNLIKDRQHARFTEPGRERLLVSGRYALLVLLYAVICVVAVYGYDYMRLKGMESEFKAESMLVSRLQAQAKKNELTMERLEGRLDALKERLDKLAQMEADIRILAGIEPRTDSSAGSGMGGIDARSDAASTMIGKEGEKDLVSYIDHQLNLLNRSVSLRTRSMKRLISVLELQRSILSITPSLTPVSEGRISSGFGYRKSPFTGEREFHTGVDIACKLGTPVVATAGGIVEFAGNLGNLGNTVVITHGHGLVTRYGHLQRFVVEKGARVEKGEIIGFAGSTGRSTGPHLHYEVRFNGIPMDPRIYMSPDLSCPVAMHSGSSR